MKIKIPIKITTELYHSDEEAYAIEDFFVGKKEETTEIEVEINDEVVNSFRTMYPSNILRVEVEGEKEFEDGEEIA